MTGGGPRYANGRHRDGRPINGVVRPSMEAHCASCQQGALGLGLTVTQANQQLLRMGWRRDGNGLWCCDDCQTS